MSPDLADRSRPGRPRSSEADVAILGATAELFTERGYAGVTVEAVADRAGVAKSTVYRRYPGKPELVLAAVAHTLGGPPTLVATGDLEDDLVAALQRVRAKLASPDTAGAIPAAMVAAAQHPEFGRLHRRFVTDARSAVLDLVRAGIERGDVAADTDPEMLVDLLGGAVFYRVLNTGGAVDDDALRELVRRVVRAFR